MSRLCEHEDCGSQTEGCQRHSYVPERATACSGSVRAAESLLIKAHVLDEVTITVDAMKR